MMLYITIGYNSVNLLGCENDALIVYNLNSHLKVNYKKYLLIGNDVTLLNLEKIFKNNKYTTNLTIYFSGHGFFGGNLKFFDKIINPLEIYELINKTFINNLNIFFILDCCYSGSFPVIRDFQKIMNVSILASSKNDEKSSECLIKNTFKLNNHFYNFKKEEDYIIMGTFTYNLVKLIKKYDLINIEEWFLRKNELT